MKCKIVTGKTPAELEKNVQKFLDSSKKKAAKTEDDTADTEQDPEKEIRSIHSVTPVNGGVLVFYV